MYSFRIDFFFFTQSPSFSLLHIINSLFLFTSGSYSGIWTDHTLRNHSPTEGHLGCFQFVLCLCLVTQSYLTV